jgi:hypothetical protein
VFTEIHLWTLSCDTRIQSTTSLPVSSVIIILTSGHKKSSFSSVSFPKTNYMQQSAS